MNLRNRRAWVGWLALGAMMLACELAFARAGGGDGFSSGGGGGFSGGGGGGDGDGAGLLLYPLLRLVFAYPLIGIPLLIVAAVVFYRSSKGAQSAYISSTIRRGLAVGRAANAEEGLPGIRQRDPAFDLDAFLGRCCGLLPPVQEAWSRQDMSPVRHVLSDGVFDRFALQIAMQKGSGIRNDMSHVRVLGSRLVGSASDRFFDTLHVAVTAEAVDTTVALEGGRRLLGSGAPESFTEVWTFLRRPGAKTLAHPGLLEGHCPNCGTRLRLSTSITCEACQALINSGEYDWVLTEITQMEVWSPHAVEQLQGVAELRQRDPGFNPQAIEDRVSAIFWHHRAAEFFGSDEHLRAVALPSFLEGEMKGWRADGQGRHPFYADAAVGSVDLAEVLPDDGRDGMDRVRVFVQWSGHRELRQPSGLLTPQWERSRLMRQEYVLARKCGVQSVQAAALTSLHCPGCGAPQVAKQDGTCRYCGMPQNDGSTSWVLESVSAFSGFATVAVQEATQSGVAGMAFSPSERDAMIQCVVAVMLADDVVDPREVKLLRQMTARHNIPVERLGEFISRFQKDREIDRPQFEDWEHRSAFVKLLIQMCLTDGNVSHSERQVLRALVAHMGYTDVDVDLMITRERADLYAASKEALKAKAGVRPQPK